MAEKGIRKKHPRIHAQTEGFYEEIRKEQQKNIVAGSRRGARMQPRTTRGSGEECLFSM